MPDPHTITITFPDEDINGTDELQMILTITVNTNDDNEAYTAAAKNLEYANGKHGTLEWKYEIDKALLVPGVLNVSIYDQDSYLDGLLFSETDLDKQIKVELKLNQASIWIGYATTSDMKFDAGNDILSFKATPRTDLLNSTTAYGPNGETHDPLGYSDTGQFAISAATHAGGVVTVTHAADAGFNLGLTVLIASVTGMTEINGYHLITEETDATHFKIAYTTDQAYTANGTAQVMAIGGDPFMTITDFMEDIFQVVESTISYGTGQIKLQHDWIFNADAGMTQFAISNAVHAGGTVTITHANQGGQFATGDDIWIADVTGMTDLNSHFENVTVNSNTETEVSLTTAQGYTAGGQLREVIPDEFRDLLINSFDVFFSINNPVRLVNKTLADVLKSLAFQMGCFTGMVHSNLAFMNKLYQYDSGNLQTLGEVLQESHEYRFPVIEYVEIAAPDLIPQREGTLTEREDQIIQRDDLALYFKGTYPGGFSTSDFKADDVAGDPFIVNVRDAETNTGDAFLDMANQTARYWYFHRNDPVKTRVDTFTVVGVDYDFLANFNLDSKKYSITGMKIDYDNNQTLIEAIYLGAV